MPPEHPSQLEFLLAGAAEGAPALTYPLADLREKITDLWRLPIDQRVRVDLRDCNVSRLEGQLQLVRAPDFPLDVRHALDLEVGTVRFSSRQIVDWALI